MCRADRHGLTGPVCQDVRCKGAEWDISGRSKCGDGTGRPARLCECSRCPTNDEALGETKGMMTWPMEMLCLAWGACRLCASAPGAALIHMAALGEECATQHGEHGLAGYYTLYSTREGLRAGCPMAANAVSEMDNACVFPWACTDRSSSSRADCLPSSLAVGQRAQVPSPFQVD